MINVMSATGLQKSFDKTFGNYMVHGIEEVYLPDTIAWWPQTLGWKVLALLILAAFCYFIYRRIVGWRKNKYRRLALEEIDKLEAKTQNSLAALRGLPIILKSTALRAFPRSDIAQLSGAAWIAELNNRCKRLVFTESIAGALMKVSYHPQESWQIDRPQIEALLEQSRYWVRAHKAAAGAESDV